MAKYDQYESFKKYRVEAKSLFDFLKRYTKKSYLERLEHEGQEFIDARYESFKTELRRFGFAFISKHDSITGEVVAYYGDCENEL